MKVAREEVKDGRKLTSGKEGKVRGRRIYSIRSRQ